MSLLQHVALPGQNIPAGIRPACPEYPLATYQGQPPVGLAPVEAMLVEFSKTVASSTVPERLTDTDLFVSEFSIKHAGDSGPPLKFGYSAANDSQLWSLQPTEWISRTAPAGKKINLKKIYIDVGANGQSVIVHAIA